MKEVELVERVLILMLDECFLSLAGSNQENMTRTS